MPLNEVNLIGNVTREIELKYTPKGTAVAEMGLAINRTTKDADGQRRDEVTFVDVTLWGRDAEVAAEYLAKGRETCVKGRLQLDTWDDKQSGQKRSKLRVVCEQLILLSNGGNKGGDGGHGGGEGGSRRESNGRPNGNSGYGPNGGGSRNGGGAPASGRTPARTPAPRPPVDPDIDGDGGDDIPF